MITNSSIDTLSLLITTVVILISLWLIHDWTTTNLKQRNEHLKRRNRKLITQNHELQIKADALKFKAKDCFFCDPDRENERMLP